MTVELEIVGGPCPEPYQIVRVFTATDGCGNSTSATQTISIGDASLGCPEDLDGDGFVGVSDVLLALGEFGCTENCTVDLDGDSATSVSDVLVLLSSFGESCL